MNIIKHNNYIYEDLNAIEDRLLDDEFRIVVVGEFSSGKSTFINAIIGKDVLLHAVDETTATITYIHNVKKDDERAGRGKICYSDGTIVEFKNFTELRKYTTTQSEIKVADTIKNVDIYISFLNIDQPLTIVDTPGLNGVADKHKEITIEETKKAHACIYLLSAKGLADSDLSFIKILRNYQTEFVFVQNFIDTLRSTEGETPEKKINMIESILKREFGDDKHFSYTICAISALMSLVGKDENIKHLYANDEVEIKPDERKNMYKNSNFEELESIISGYINTGKYKKVIVESAIQSLNSILQMLLQSLYIQDKQNEELLKNDSKNDVIAKAQGRLNELDNNFENNKKKIRNFIISRDKENRSEYKRAILIQLKNIYEMIVKNIDVEIRYYEDFDRIEQFSNKKVGLYFAEKVTSEINAKIIPKLDNDMKVGYQVLYSDALLRAEKYSGQTNNILNKKLSIIEVKSDSRLNIDVQEKLYEINRKKSQLKKEEEKTSLLNIQLNIAKQEVSKNNKDIEKENMELNTNKEIYHNRQKQIGKKPDIEYEKIRMEREVPRGGIFGKIKDFFCSPKIEVYYETIIDDSKLKCWEKETQANNEKLMKAQQSYNINIERLREKLHKFEGDEKKAKMELEKNIQKINLLKNAISAEEYEYSTIIINAKKEFCNSQKQKLKKQFEEKLFDESYVDSTLCKIRRYIDNSSEINIPRITNIIIKSFEENVKHSKDMLNNIVNQNTIELENHYYEQKKDIELLKKIQDEIMMIKEV
ncbi:MAG: dynamin family protein [Clostridium sp.]